jgi:hypothetical protein
MSADRTSDDADDADLPAVEPDAVSTGAAADSVDCNERLKGLPRILRFAMLISHNAANSILYRPRGAASHKSGIQPSQQSLGGYGIAPIPGSRARDHSRFVPSLLRGIPQCESNNELVLKRKAGHEPAPVTNTGPSLRLSRGCLNGLTNRTPFKRPACLCGARATVSRLPP